jgi:NAD(P)H-flavin reductase
MFASKGGVVFLITRRKQFGPTTFLWDVHAPDVARAARPGHFIMARIDERGERIPLTVADFNAILGTVTVVIQAVGKTTFEMMTLRKGDAILDFIGPLGLPSHIRKLDGTVVLVGGGLGVAPIFPQLREYKNAGNRTISIVGFRNRDLMFWEDQFREFSDELIVTTDDGSYGRKGFVSHALADVVGTEKDVREVVAIGPLPMMKACCEVTRPLGISTIVSLNSIRVRGRRGFRRTPGEFRRAGAAAETLRARGEGGAGTVPERIGETGQLENAGGIRRSAGLDVRAAAARGRAAGAAGP